MALVDDTHDVSLSPSLVDAPPMQLWPSVVAQIAIRAGVDDVLLWMRGRPGCIQVVIEVEETLFRGHPDVVDAGLAASLGLVAAERKHADRAPRPGRARRREFEYIRHGTQALTAALDVHCGRVLGRCTDRRTQADLVGFMQDVARA